MDSTTLHVCKIQRIERHKSLKQIATRGKSSMGWFYGCKLHVLVDAQGQFIQTQLSNGHYLQRCETRLIHDSVYIKIQRHKNKKLGDKICRHIIEILLHHIFSINYFEFDSFFFWNKNILFV